MIEGMDRLGVGRVVVAWAVACGPAASVWATPAEAPASEPPVAASAPAPSADEAAGASDPAPTDAASRPLSYQIGVAVSWRPTYAGSTRMDLGARPVLSLQWGRFRITSSQAGLVEGPPDGSSAAGAGVALVDNARWSSGAVLRVDNGRAASDDPRLAGLPEVRRTVRGRFFARYTLDGAAADQRALGASLSTDLLNRQGGTTVSLDASRRVQLAPSVRWTHGIGVSAADGVYMRSHYGVPASVAPNVGLRAYEPGAGLVDLHLGTGLIWRVHERWRVGGALTVARLLGPALASPLTQGRMSHGVVIGLAYISGRD